MVAGSMSASDGAQVKMGKVIRPIGVQRRSYPGQSVSAEANDWQAIYNNWHGDLYDNAIMVCVCASLETGRAT